MLRYHAYYRNSRDTLTEIIVEMAPGGFANRTETPTGREFRTDVEAMAAMRAANCAGCI
jgi:hypothetical protein